MKVYSLVGPSGSGKSHRAVLLANQHQIPLIIDDGLLIHSGKIMAGSSAKKEESKMGAIRRALFYDEEQTKAVKRAIKEIKADKILILGTSTEMVVRIVDRLELDGINQAINIRDISTPAEIEKALAVRNKEGKHVIPVPTIEVKKEFTGYLVHSLELFFKKDDRTIRHEKTIVRPKFSFYGNLSISNRVLVDLVNFFIKQENEITDCKRIKVEEKSHQLFINLSIELTFGTIIPAYCSKFRLLLKNRLEKITGLEVNEIIVEIFSLNLN